jgi:hypothetical protein
MSDDLLTKELSSFEFPNRLASRRISTLRHQNINCIKDLLEHDEVDLSGIYNLGKKGISEIREFLKSNGYDLDPGYRKSLKKKKDYSSDRGLFAAMAMQGLLASGKPITLNGKNEHIDVAAVKFADALLMELEKPKE